MTREEFAAIEILRKSIPSKPLKGSLDDLLKNLPYLGLTAKAQAAIREVFEIQTALVHGHVRMVCYLANRLHNRYTVVIDKEDLIQVGLTALLSAVFGYSNPNVKFFTYAHQTVFQRMVRELAKSHGTKQLTERNRRLLAFYYRAMTVNSENNSFDDVVGRMRVTIGTTDRPPTADEIDILNKIFVSFTHEADMKLGLAASVADDEDEDVALWEYMDKAGLTKIERAAIIAAQDGHGWGARFGREQGVSREWARKILRRAHDKVEKARQREAERQLVAR
jgi:DNA-directed RNA polymerase sigma subunit (sigma70/sigma32)